MKRLGIFVFFDKDGVVDDYVDYLLRDITKCLSRLIIVCNSPLNDIGREIFLHYTEEIYLRENRGFDAAAWQDVLVNKLGLDALNQYDELVLFNDTFYGPFYPFSDVFYKMESKQVDFWGLTIHADAPDSWGKCEYGYLPEHIQSYFTVYRSRLIHSNVFRSYWENLPVAKNFVEAVCYNEVRQTKYFFDAGFSYGVLCDTRVLMEGYDGDDNHVIYNPLMLIRQYGCPILKRKVFVTDREYLLNVNHATAPVQIIDYLKRETSYDVNLILKYLIRTVDPLQLKQFLGSNYIIDSCRSKSKICEKQVLIVAKIIKANTAGIFIDFLRNAKGIVKYLIITEHEEIRRLCCAELGEDKVEFAELHRDIEPLVFWQPYLDVMQRYDIIGTFDDSMFQAKPRAVFSADLSLADNVWCNLLGNRECIANIVNLFNENNCLGIVVPPFPYSGVNILSFLKPWMKYLRALVQLVIGSSDDEMKKYNNAPYIFDANMWMTVEAANAINEGIKKIEKDAKKDHLGQYVPMVIPYWLKDGGLMGINVLLRSFAMSTLENQRILLGHIVKMDNISMFKALVKNYFPSCVVKIIRYLKNKV